MLIGKPFGIGPSLKFAVPVEHLAERVGGQRADEVLELDRNAALRDLNEAALGRAHDIAVEAGLALPLLGPQELLDRGVEDLHPAVDRRVTGERPEPVVDQERRRRPDADERGHAGEAQSPARHLELPASRR